MSTRKSLSEDRRAELVGALYAALDIVVRTGRDSGPEFERVDELIRARDAAIARKERAAQRLEDQQPLTP